MSTLAKGGGAKKRFEYCVNPNSSNQFLYLHAVQGHSGDNAFDLALQDNVLLPKRFTQYVYHVGNTIEFLNDKWINSRKNKPQQRKTSGFLHHSESDGWWIWHGRNCTHSDKTSDHAEQEYFETPSKYNTWVQCEARSRERLAIYGHMQSFSSTHCDMHENSGWALPEGALNSESATSRARIELTIWSARSTKPRSKIVLGTIKRFEKILVATPWTAEYLEYLFPRSSRRIHCAKMKSRSWSRSSRTTNTKNPSFRTWARRRRSPISAENRRVWSPTWASPRSSNFAKILPNNNVLTAMPTGKKVSSIVAVEEIWNPRRVQQSSTRTTVTSRQSLDMWLRRTAVVEPSTDLLKDKDVLPS